MLTKFCRKSRHDICQAPLYNSGGSTTRNTTSGFNCTFGIPGTKLSANPAITSTIGYGVLIFCANTANATTNTSNASAINSAACTPSPFIFPPQLR